VIDATRVWCDAQMIEWAIGSIRLKSARSITFKS
jgi:hypothetical protein